MKFNWQEAEKSYAESKVSPISDGIYKVRIINAENKVSKNGNKMIAVTAFNVRMGDGSDRKIEGKRSDGTTFGIYHIVELSLIRNIRAFGVEKEYEDAKAEARKSNSWEINMPADAFTNKEAVAVILMESNLAANGEVYTNAKVATVVEPGEDAVKVYDYAVRRRDAANAKLAAAQAAQQSYTQPAPAGTPKLDDEIPF